MNEKLFKIYYTPYKYIVVDAKTIIGSLLCENILNINTTGQDIFDEIEFIEYKVNLIKELCSNDDNVITIEYNEKDGLYYTILFGLRHKINMIVNSIR